MAEFSNRVAIITGSSSGIGEETAQRLSELGATVVVNSSSSVEAGEAVSEALPGESMYVRADISKQDEGHALVDATIERYGRLDYLINNAGWTSPVQHGDLDGLTDEIFQKTFDINVYGTWWLTKHAIPHLQKSDDPNIVMMGSIAGLRPTGSSIAYCMSKAAVNHMTVVLAKAFAPIRVNAVAPGMVATPWWEGEDELIELVGSMTPLGRVATAEDCAEAVLGFIRNKFTTGSIVVVDGGLTLVS